MIISSTSSVIDLNSGGVNEGQKGTIAHPPPPTPTQFPKGKFFKIEIPVANTFFFFMVTLTGLDPPLLEYKCAIISLELRFSHYFEKVKEMDIY